MSYSDVDKDGNAEFIYIFEEHDDGPNSPTNKSWAVLVHNNKAYRIYKTDKDNFTEIYKEDNFMELSDEIKTYFIEDAIEFLP